MGTQRTAGFGSFIAMAGARWGPRVIGALSASALLLMASTAHADSYSLQHEWHAMVSSAACAVDNADAQTSAQSNARCH